jgi:hypothetical protein
MKTHEELFSHRNGYCDCVKEKKCTCGDTETQHYENTDKCVVCGCKEFTKQIQADTLERFKEDMQNLVIKEEGNSSKTIEQVINHIDFLLTENNNKL